MMGILTGLVLLAQLSPAPADPVIVAVGDSITQGAGSKDPGVQSWPALIGAHRAGEGGGCVISDPCFSGQAPMVQTFDASVLAQHPDIVVIAYGINDIYSGPEAIFEGLKELAHRTRAAGARPYVATVTPQRGKQHEAYHSIRSKLNRMIRQHFGARVIDFDKALRNPRGKMWPRFDSGDGLHPNADAYEVMAGVAARALAR